MRRLPRWPQIATLLVLLLALGYLAWLGWGLLPGNEPEETDDFDGKRALALAQDLCDIGPRPAGSAEAKRTSELILEELKRQGWETAEQVYAVGDTPLRNVAGLAGDEGPLLVIAAHYDTRSVSDLDPDPDKQEVPSPGANDDGSGVAILLELARALDLSRIKHQVWLVFLDGDAEVGLPDWEQSSGARQFIDGRYPGAVIYLNRVGATDATFPQPPSGARSLQLQLWKLADELGLEETFLPKTGPKLTDAHTVFLDAGIPTAAIIQPDYPYTHTTEDTCDKLDADTLSAVGALLEKYLEDGYSLTFLQTIRK